MNRAFGISLRTTVLENHKEVKRNPKHPQADGITNKDLTHDRKPSAKLANFVV